MKNVIIKLIFFGSLAGNLCSIINGISIDISPAICALYQNKNIDVTTMKIQDPHEVIDDGKGVGEENDSKISPFMFVPEAKIEEGVREKLDIWSITNFDKEEELENNRLSITNQQSQQLRSLSYFKEKDYIFEALSSFGLNKKFFIFNMHKEENVAQDSKKHFYGNPNKVKSHFSGKFNEFLKEVSKVNDLKDFFVNSSDAKILFQKESDSFYDDFIKNAPIPAEVEQILDALTLIGKQRRNVLGKLKPKFKNGEFMIYASYIKALLNKKSKLTKKDVQNAAFLTAWAIRQRLEKQKHNKIIT